MVNRPAKEIDLHTVILISFSIILLHAHSRISNSSDLEYRDLDWIEFYEKTYTFLAMNKRAITFLVFSRRLECLSELKLEIIPVIISNLYLLQFPNSVFYIFLHDNELYNESQRNHTVRVDSGGCRGW